MNLNPQIGTILGIFFFVVFLIHCKVFKTSALLVH